jgi:hypothetical protein
VSTPYVVAPVCGVCGAPNHEQRSVCLRCGSHLTLPVPPGPAPWAAYTPGQPYTRLPNRQMAAAVPHKSSSALPWLVAVGGILALVVSLAGLALVIGGGGPSGCPFPCSQPPPRGAPLLAPHTYTSKLYGYQVQYYDGSAWLPPSQFRRIKLAVQDDKSIAWTFDATGASFAPGGGQWPYGFTGQAASGRSPVQVVEDYRQSKYPQAELVYQLPAAGLGYESGWGGVYDLMVRPTSGQSVHARLFLIASIKRGTAVIFEGLGPYAPPTNGQPNPSRTPLAHLFAPLLNQVIMPGDQPV